MPTSSRNAIYDATIRRMTACALEEAENRFAVEHAQDTEQQLADYLRKYADELGHTPWPREIPGGVTIQTRFGSWEAAVAEALDTGQLSWAAVDVLSAEPPERDSDRGGAPGRAAGAPQASPRRPRPPFGVSVREADTPRKKSGSQFLFDRIRQYTSGQTRQAIAGKKIAESTRQVKTVRR